MLLSLHCSTAQCDLPYIITIPFLNPQWDRKLPSRSNTISLGSCQSVAGLEIEIEYIAALWLKLSFRLSHNNHASAIRLYSKKINWKIRSRVTVFDYVLDLEFLVLFASLELTIDHILYKTENYEQQPIKNTKTIFKNHIMISVVRKDGPRGIIITL